MLPQKRLLIAAAGTLAATLSLAGCGSGDYGLSSAETAKLGAPPAAEPAAVAPAAGGDAEADATDETDATDEAADEAAEDIVAKPAKPVGKVTNKLVSKKVPKMGNVVTDSKGWVLYRFDKDEAKPSSKSNCFGDCAKLWPPMLADETLELSGISAKKVGTIKRSDGGRQVTLDGWPLYRYIGDKTPGKWTGQNVGGTWFVADKNGKKNLTCLPKISKPVALPEDPADDVSADDADSSGY